MDDIDRYIFEHHQRLSVDRIIRDRSDPFDTVSDFEFRRRFRFTRRAFFQLVSLLEIDLDLQCNRSTPLLPHQKVGLSLECWASNTFQATIAILSGCNQSTVSRTLTQVGEAIVKRSHYFVKWPEEEERMRIGRSFMNIGGVPNIIGCVDGTHIRIPSPQQNEYLYVNRKGYHSINVGLICDDQLRFIWYSARYPGSSHDSRVFKESVTYSKLSSKEYKGIIIGDSAYKAEPFLLKPILDPKTESDKTRKMGALLYYAIAELLLSIHISFSNLLVLWVYVRSKHVRTVTNTYIFSLALTDFLAGAIGIPLTVVSVMTKKPRTFYGCLFVHLILCILCTISTFHMLAIAIDKYVTICCRDRIFSSRRKRAIFLLATSWTLGFLIAILPIFNVFGFAETRSNFIQKGEECQFTDVVDYRYLVYVIFFATILAPTFIIVILYSSIYSRIRTEEKQVKCLLRQSERERRMQGRRKLIRILLILVVSYGICWYPLYIINTIDYFWPEFSINSLTLWTVIMSHMSCALNPLIYAYGMPGFKKALRAFFNIQTDPNNTCANYSCYIRSTANQKQRSISVRGIPYDNSMSAIRKISAPTPTMLDRQRTRRRQTVDHIDL